MAQIRPIIFAILLVAFVALSLAEDSSKLLPETDDPLPFLVRKPRFISVRSRLHPDAEYEKGIGFRGHLNNVLKGGSIGLEFQMPKEVNRLIEKLKIKLASLFGKSEMDRKNDWEEDRQREWEPLEKQKRM